MLSQEQRPALPSHQEASGCTLGEEEISLLAEVIRSRTLTRTKGPFVKTLEQQFAELLGVQYAYACASGTAAVHTAIAAVNPDPGHAILTLPITDMGVLTPILYRVLSPSSSMSTTKRLQLIKLVILALQRKCYFEEFFRLGSTIYRFTREDDRW